MGVETEEKNEVDTNQHDPPEQRPQNAGEALDAVLEHAGPMGWYQRWLFLAMLPFGLTMAFSYFITIFSVATPESHWCFVPELSHLDSTLKRNLSIPGASTAGDDFQQWDRCARYDANWSSVLETLEPPPPGAPTQACDNGWVFEFDDVPYETVVSERYWVCGKAANVPTAQMMFSIGSFAGGLLFGWLADQYGRVPALVGANMVAFIGGVASIFTTTMWDFTLCRFIVGMCYDNCFMLMYILVLEYVGASHRTWVANLSIMLYFGGGATILPWIALGLNNWRLLVLVTSLPALAALAAPFLLPESARWLSSRGKSDRAVSMLKRLERVNGTRIPQEVLDEFVVQSSKTEDNGENLRTLATHSRLRILFILLILLYTASAIIFDVIARLSSSLGMNMFIAFTVSSATEFPSLLVVILLLDRLGRRAMAVGTFTATSILCIVAAFVPKGYPRAAIAFSARFFINMSFNTVIQWVAETLPTGARGAGSSIVHVTAFLAASSAPFIVFSESVWSGLPFVIIGAVGLVAAVTSAFLPETAGLVMPHSCEDAERLIQQHSLWGKLSRNAANKKTDVDQEIADTKLRSSS